MEAKNKKIAAYATIFYLGLFILLFCKYPFAFSQVLYLASYFRSVTGSSFAVMATV